MKKKLNKILLAAAIVCGILMAVIHGSGSNWFMVSLVMAIIGALVIGWIFGAIISLIENKFLKKETGLTFKSAYLMALVFLLFGFTFFGKIDCSKHAAAYRDGYTMGEADKAAGKNIGGSISLSNLNKAGIYPHVVNDDDDKDCYCAGYADGNGGEKKEY
jgi:hypothetical protein